MLSDLFVLLRLLVDLLLYLEVDLPVGVGDLELLAAFSHLRNKLSEHVFGRHSREEAVGSASTSDIEVLHGENDGVGVVSLGLGELGILTPAVELVAYIDSSASRLRLNVGLHGLLAVLFLSGNLLVLLVTGGEFLAHFDGSGVLVALQPWVSNDIGD